MLQTLLIVAPDSGTRAGLCALAVAAGYVAAHVSSAEEALEELAGGQAPAALLMDRELPGLDALDATKQIRARCPELPLVVLGTTPGARPVVEALQAGADGWLHMPFEVAELARTLARATAARAAARAPAPPGVLLGESPRMRALARTVERVADTDLTVLIRGESGSGKELVARWLARRCSRRGAFVKINCAALPGELLESELFGYEKGAFTGADERRGGRYGQAEGGTIFLDEISELDLRLQAKLLQVLQEGRFSRLGSEGDVSVDARVIAATHGDLGAAVSEGSFREDLFYRLNVVTVEVPPLRERRDEILPLARHFASRFAAEAGRPVASFSDELLELFATHAWPGNVRELENLVHRVALLGAEAPVIDELRERVERARQAGETRPELARFLAGELPSVDLKGVGREAARVAEARLIRTVLARTRWNRRAAAEILEISYKALLYKIKDAGLASSA